MPSTMLFQKHAYLKQRQHETRDVCLVFRLSAPFCIAQESWRTAGVWSMSFLFVGLMAVPDAFMLSSWKCFSGIPTEPYTWCDEGIKLSYVSHGHNSPKRDSTVVVQDPC